MSDYSVLSSGALPFPPSPSPSQAAAAAIPHPPDPPPAEGESDSAIPAPLPLAASLPEAHRDGQPSADAPGDRLFVVGIGTSTGGLRALPAFLAQLPPDTGAAYVVVQPRSPDHDRSMHAVLASSTRLPMYDAQSEMVLTPNSIYLIPPGQQLALQQGQIQFIPPAQLADQPEEWPIDLFFQSLADDLREEAIAVILSGSGSDGSRGIQAVHHRGGVVLVQDPATAECAEMPRAAIATGVVDLVSTIPNLVRLIEQVTAPSRDRAARQSPPAASSFETALVRQILDILASAEGLDLSSYRLAPIHRRIQRRCLLSGSPNLEHYLTVLNRAAIERHHLSREVLVATTHFFRDPELWNHLAATILPDLMDQMTPANPLRIWVTACATGEEAYSMAMVLDELARSRQQPLHVQLFATDVDPHRLQQAKQGQFGSEIAHHVSPQRLQRYFTQRGDRYEIARSLRQMIVFAPHNLLTDAPLGQMQVITCRNLLIYLQQSAQQHLLRQLHAGLHAQGILVIGTADRLGPLRSEFLPETPPLGIYRKRRTLNLTPMSASGHPTHHPASPLPTPAPVGQSSPSTLRDRQLQAAFRLLAKAQAGCCLILNDRSEVMQVFGATPDLLPPPDGSVSHQVTDMVAVPLQLPLQAALSHARQHSGSVQYSAIQLEPPANSPVNLWVVFHPANQLTDAFFIVWIRPDELRSPASPADSRADSHTESYPDSHPPHSLPLETELQHTRLNLQTTSAALESVTVKQQATNEALMAANEDLHRANAELHAVNAELNTINVEYQTTIRDLQEINDDLDNLIANIEGGVVFLDRHLSIRKFTPLATQVFALTDQDVGRSISDLAHRLDSVDVDAWLQHVATTDEPIEATVQHRDRDQHWLLRVRPYRLSGDPQAPQFNGLVLTLVDITEIQRVKRSLQEHDSLLQTILDASPDPIFVKDADGRYLFVNQPVLTILNRRLDEVLGADDLALWPEAIAQPIRDRDRQILASGEAQIYEEAMQSASGTTIHYLTSKSVVRNDHGTPVHLVGFARDITPLKQAQAELEAVNQALQREVAQRQSALLALQESEQRFRSTFEQAAVGIAHVAPNGTFLRVNQRFADILGHPKAKLLTKTFQDLTLPEDFGDDSILIEQLLAGDRNAYTVAKRYVRQDHSIVWAELTVALVRNPDGEPLYFISVVQDISLQRQLESERDRILQELIHEKELAQVTLHSIGDAVVTTDAEGIIQYCNPVAEYLTGWSLAEAQGRSIQDVITLQDEETRQPTQHPVLEVLAQPNHSIIVENVVLISRHQREYNISKSASVIVDRRGQIVGTVTVFRDVTEARRLSQQLSWQASHDPLTGLINRRQFEQELQHLIETVHHDDRQEHVLCYLDLDQFKVVNDTSGHLAGDELLRQVAALLSGQVRSSDCLARLGGDEFGVLLRSCPLARAEIIANALREVVQDMRFVWEDRTYSIGVSIGLVALNAESTDLQTVLSAADAACYAAKERGRNRVHIYQPDDQDVARQRGERQWSVEIRSALEQNRFCLYQQRIEPTRAAANLPIRYEILVRMIDRSDQLIPPNTFIPAAERYDLMPYLDRWVIQQFFYQLEQGQLGDGQERQAFMVNLSGASFTDDAFLTFLQTELAQRSAIAAQVCFEITETAAISNLVEAVDFINAIKRIGCQFALDDFGSGMSSFGYLKTLPVDFIKIDGKFVRDLTTDSTARAIVESINHIGHVMQLQTIAESVEDEAMRRVLTEIGVDYVQGYGVDLPTALPRWDRTIEAAE